MSWTRRWEDSAPGRHQYRLAGVDGELEKHRIRDLPTAAAARGRRPASSNTAWSTVWRVSKKLAPTTTAPYPTEPTTGSQRGGG